VLGTRRLRFLGGSFGTFELTSSLDKSIFELLFREEVFAHAICLRLNQSGYLKLFDRKQFGNFFTAVFQSFEYGNFTMSCFAFGLWIEKINIGLAMGAKLAQVARAFSSWMTL